MPVSKSSCPADTELRMFVNEQLNRDSQCAVADHVDRCSNCAGRLDAICDEFNSGNEDASATIESPVNSISEESEARVQKIVQQLKETPWWERDGHGPWPQDSGQGYSLSSNTEEREPAVTFPGAPTESAPLGVLGTCEIQEHLGSGATSHLYRAFDTQLNRAVAIKLLRSELAAQSNARARFEREAHAIAQLNDSRIVMIYGVFAEEGFPPWIQMELVNGESLEDLSDHRDTVFSPQAAAEIMIEILGALSVAHAAGIIHRDVKPANVLISAETNSIKLADFGLARFDDQAIDLTAQGTLAGTPAYMSPEQILNPQDVTISTDLYSAGTVFYELLTRQLPFRGALRMVLQQVLHDDPQLLRRFDDRIPRDLENICLKAISKDPSRRYASADAFRDDLKCYLQGKPVLARPVHPLERLTRWCRRNSVVSGLTTVLIIFVLAGVSSWVHFTISVTRTNERLGDSNTSLVNANRELDVAIRRASIGERRAQSNAALAEQQLNIAFNMITGLVSHVQDELARHPGLVELRRNLLQHAIDGLDQVAVSTATSEVLEVNRAVAENRLGDAFRELSEPQRALQHYAAARASLLALIDNQNSDDVDGPANVQLLLAITETNCGDLYKDDADLESAGRAYELALEHAQQACGTDPLDAASRQHLVIALDRCGQLAWDQGDGDKARNYLRRALEAARESVNLQPGVGSLVESWGLAALRFANVSDDPENSDVRSELDRVSTSLTDHAQLHTVPPSHRLTLAAVELRRARLIESEDVEYAIQFCRRSVNELEHLLTLYPQHLQGSRDLAVSESQLGAMLLRAGRIAPASETLQTAWRTMERSQMQESTEFADRQAVASCLLNLLSIERISGSGPRFQLAHAQAQQLIDSLAPLCARSDTRITWLREQRRILAELQPIARNR